MRLSQINESLSVASKNYPEKVCLLGRLRLMDVRTSIISGSILDMVIGVRKSSPI